jgi:hypothetical protein
MNDPEAVQFIAAIIKSIDIASSRRISKPTPTQFFDIMEDELPSGFTSRLFVRNFIRNNIDLIHAYIDQQTGNEAQATQFHIELESLA